MNEQSSHRFICFIPLPDSATEAKKFHGHIAMLLRDTFCEFVSSSKSPPFVLFDHIII
jgi:hypothetical protein